MSDVPTTPLNEDLVLPLAGEDGVVREYHVKPTRAGQWIRLTVLRDARQKIEDKRKAEAAKPPKAAPGLTAEERAAVDTSHLTLLGKETAEQMIADDVLMSDMQRACTAAEIYHLSGCDTGAALAWFNPKAPTPSSTPKARTGAAASTTRRRSSTSGTTSPKATK